MNARFYIVSTLVVCALFLSGCGSKAPEKASSGPSGFSGQDIDEIKPQPKAEAPAGKHKTPGPTLTAATFETEVAQAKGVVLVDFWASWCVPCRQIAPVLEEFSTEFAGKMKFANVDLTDESDKNPIATRFNIENLPTLILFKDGKEVGRKIGALPKDDLKAWIQGAL
jgi:thioredoxin 1